MKAVLWDMDGTMLDTEQYWFASEIELMREAGLAWSMADALGQVGQPIPATAEVLRARGLAGSVDAIAAELVARVRARMNEGLPWQPGVLPLLADLKAAGIGLALVTMAARPLAEATLSGVPGIFDVVVTAEDVRQRKPDPAAYRRAMSGLGVAPEACVAIEDSVPGVQSAWASGAVTLAVRRYADLSLVDKDHEIETFEGMTTEELGRIHRRGLQRRLVSARRSGKERLLRPR